MKDFKRNYKQLYKAYEKRLKKLHKTSTLNIDNSLDSLVVNLRFIRDYFLLTESPVNADGTENYKISTIATAISEYDQYLTCIHNIKCYADNEASLNKYETEKQFHWSCFWEIVRQNMMLWRIEDATI